MLIFVFPIAFFHNVCVYIYNTQRVLHHATRRGDNPFEHSDDNDDDNNNVHESAFKQIVL